MGHGRRLGAQRSGVSGRACRTAAERFMLRPQDIDARGSAAGMSLPPVVRRFGADLLRSSPVDIFLAVPTSLAADP